MTTLTAPPPAWTREANLKSLLLGYWSAPEDTQDEDDAFNALCDAISEAMDAACPNGDLLADWEEWNLKATQREIIEGGLQRLHLDTLQQEAWEEFQRTRTDW